MPLGESTSQLLVLYSKDLAGEVTRKVIAACRFVPLVRGAVRP
jgi:protein-L-isoaspartate O-methyltransferase